MAKEAVRAEIQAREQTVLIAEDEVLVRLMLAEFLRECGYRVIETANAAEAMAVLEQNQIEIGVLLTDVHMPGGMNGFALARWTRQRRPEIRVIITSGHEKAAHEASDLCDDLPYVKKPYDPRQLAADIRMVLDRR